MTLLVADIALWQQGLTIAQLRAAGVGAINVKVSHGLGLKSVHPDAARWIAEARAAGMGVSTFHWLDSSALGADQAVHAHQQIRALAGSTTGVAHLVDVESELDPPSEACYRDYVTTMTRLLGRPIGTYTGDHWWQPRSWAGKTPWLHAAPNAGYLGTYPGDTSAHWRAGYGGWADLAVMQYGVVTIAGIRVSMSAVRDVAVWEAMTGGTVTTAKANHRAARALLLQHLDMHPGRAVHNDLDPLEAGIVGDTPHTVGGDSYHLGADQLRTSPRRYSVDESARDRRGVDNNASAMDVGYFKVTTAKGTFDLYAYNAWLIGLCRAGDPDTADLREVIYSLDGDTVLRFDDLGLRTTGSLSHRTHTHLSEYRDADGHRMLRLATRWLQHIGLIPEEDDMPSAAEVAAELRPLIRADIRTEVAAQVDDIARAVWAEKLVDPRSKATPPETKTAGTYQRYADLKHDATQAAARQAVTAEGVVLREMLGAVMLKLGATADELQSFNARERDEVPITVEQMAQLLDEAIPDSSGPLTPDEARAAVLGALRTAFAGEQA